MASRIPGIALATRGQRGSTLLVDVAFSLGGIYMVQPSCLNLIKTFWPNVTTWADLEAFYEYGPTNFSTDTPLGERGNAGTGHVRWPGGGAREILQPMRRFSAVEEPVPPSVSPPFHLLQSGRPPSSLRV